MNENYTSGIKKILKYAKDEAIRLGQTYVGSEHLLLGILKDKNGNAASTLLILGCDLSKIIKSIESIIVINDTPSNIRHLPLTRRAERILKNAYVEAKNNNMKIANQNHLLLAVAKENDGLTNDIFKSFSIDYDIINSLITNNVDKNSKSNDENKNNNSKSSTPTLELYSRNITQMAQLNELDPVIGRNLEIERLSQILSRRKKNNPVLIGEPGVGKTAIVEGLALRIYEKKVPRILWDYKVIALDIASLIAGTKYRGQFEERIRKLMIEIENSNNVILFIDELHTIVGAGGATGSLDAANMFKPALARGSIQVIGATTLNEYRKYVEKDGALERRFQKILVNQPSIENTINILSGIKEKYEKHHKVLISKSALDACVELSERYITDRFLPDKAIDVMDEVCSSVHLKNINVPSEVLLVENKINKLKKDKDKEIRKQKFENAAKLRDKERSLVKKLNELQHKYQNIEEDYPIVEELDVADTVSMITGIPITKINQKESEKILKIDSKIKKVLIGQDHAIDKVVSSIQRSRAGFKNPKHPIGSFMFLGPSGVGKTELAKQLALSIFDKEDALIKIDMSEYMERYNVSRLIGAPPGYVGYEEGGQLTEKVRRNPYSIVLFDEIEKGHSDVFNLLLQILDEGKLTDSLGHQIDFKNTIIIMTSNVGTQNISSSNIGFVDNNNENNSEDLHNEVKKYFKPEFLNRIDDIIIFNSLSMNNLYKIIDLQLQDLRENMIKKGMKLKINQSAKKIILSDGAHREWGARPIRRIIQSNIENIISFKYLNNEFHDDCIIEITGKGDILAFKEIKKKSSKKKKSIKT
tara:strand:- start:364 stop:2811 length:2448 start_codon:yes stop_codon:yes gene_type:complete